MVVITYGPTLADRVLAILPGDSDAALTTADLGKLLPGERRSEISLVCHRLMKWRRVAWELARMDLRERVIFGGGYDMKEIDWFSLVAFISLAVVCFVPALMVDEPKEEPDIFSGGNMTMGYERISGDIYVANYSFSSSEGEFKAPNFTINQSWLDELSRNPTIQVSEDFGSDNLSIRLPEHPKGNITVYQGNLVVFQT